MASGGVKIMRAFDYAAGRETGVASAGLNDPLRPGRSSTQRRAATTGSAEWTGEPARVRSPTQTVAGVAQ